MKCMTKAALVSGELFTETNLQQNCMNNTDNVKNILVYVYFYFRLFNT